MDLNTIVPGQKDWVNQFNANFEKLGVDIEQSNDIVTLNGWQVASKAETYVMKIPTLSKNLRILHFDIKKDGVNPTDYGDILRIPDDFYSGTNRAVGMAYNIRVNGHDGGYMDIYFSNATTLGGALVPANNQTNAQNIEFTTSLLYW